MGATKVSAGEGMVLGTRIAVIHDRNGKHGGCMAGRMQRPERGPLRRTGWITFIQIVVLVVTSGWCAGETPQQQSDVVRPELPREWVDTTLSSPSGRTIIVPSGGDLQEALDRAQPGDEIVLEACAIYKGPFTLPDKGNQPGWIVVRSDVTDIPNFPQQGTRIDSSFTGKMPILTSSRHAVIIAQRKAHHYRFIGIEMRPADGTYLFAVVMLGDGTERDVEDLPHHVILDRCFVHGDPKKGTRRGLAMNGRYLAVIDSYFSDFKEEGRDSQAICGWNGPGPFKIVNNYLEGATENILFGGGDPSIRGLVPSDIEVRGNHAAKPLSWKPGETQYDGSHWQIKMLFELKNARRVLVDGNIFEYHWQMPGYGFAIAFTVRNQDGNAPWSVIEDVTFTNNIVRHSPNGVNILGFDDIHPPSEQTKRILIKNNLFDDINGPRWGGKGRLFQLLRGTKDVVIEHNTAFHTGLFLMTAGDPQERFVYRYNITPHNEFGMEGTGTGTGAPTLERYFPEAVVTGNIIIGGDPHRYPEGNFFPKSVQAVSFVNRAEGDFRLSSFWSSAAATEEIPGVDANALCEALGEAARREVVCVRIADRASSQPHAIGDRK
jgi:hypothetical protein